MKGITVAEFAKIKGVSPTAVHKAIDSGRLVNCLIKDPRYKKPRIDPVVAAQEWERNTDHSKRTTGKDLRPAEQRPEPFEKNPGGQQPATAKQVADSYKARLLKLEYDKKTGALIDAEKVKIEWFRLVTEAKNKVLSIPSKAKASIPALTNADIAIIDRICREALEEIANGNS